MALKGDTIRLRAEFQTFAGAYADPSSITLQMYDLREAAYGTPVAIGAEHRISAGIYEYDYAIPEDMIGSIMHYEFKGTLEDNPIVKRASIPLSWE